MTLGLRTQTNLPFYAQLFIIIYYYLKKHLSFVLVYVFLLCYVSCLMHQPHQVNFLYV
jgi:hypothetical protein